MLLELTALPVMKRTNDDIPFYTFISFLIVLPSAPSLMGLTASHFFRVAVKAFIFFAAWIPVFNAIKFPPASVCGIFTGIL